jgi:hypothetical protein
VPEFFVTMAIQLGCSAGGQFTIAAPASPVMFVKDKAVLTQADVAPKQLSVTGCTHNPQCTGFTWNTVATSVFENGAPVLVQSSPASTSDATCIPQANGAVVISSGTQDSASGV